MHPNTALHSARSPEDFSRRAPVEVTVCLCTFKRESVTRTLESLAKQTLTRDRRFEVVVVDSDLAASARDRVERAQTRLTIPIRYVVAQRPGVAEARNAAIREASGRWLAFIDDDEGAEADWLAALLRCAEEHDAQVVFGAVHTRYPEGCPDWIRSGDLFGKYLAPTGTRVAHGATCNALLARAALPESTGLFNAAYGATGGEDTELFHRLSRQGVRMVTCHEAVVSETVEEHRLTSDYLLRKAVRVGETYFRIFFAETGQVTRGALLARAGLQWFAAIAIALCLRPLSRGDSMHFRIKAAANFGKLRAAFGCDSVRLYGG